MIITKLLIFTLFFNITNELNYFLPIKTDNRKSLNTLSLTIIGEFGLLRKDRPGIPAHYHTGIDIKRPGGNYLNEPIFPISDGVVMSIRQDGPYAQIIIEHGNNHKFWTVYEHIAGIKVGLDQKVTPDQPIARFMNKNELDRYGWQFDHFHFEILKITPMKLIQDRSKPDRRFSSYSLKCFTKEELSKYFYNPHEFFMGQIAE